MLLVFGQSNVGYGTTSADKSITGVSIKKGMTISKATAERWLKESLYKKYLPKVMKYYSTYYWNENEAGALVSFAYNIGSIDQLTAYGTRSKRMIADKMLLYCKADGRKLKGLLDRRKDERKLFLTPCEPQKYKGDLPTIFPKRKYFKLGDGIDSCTELRPQIKLVQKFLNWYGDDLTVDGKYGDKTKEAVTDFQKDMRLSQNGCFGMKCIEKAKTVRR